MEWSSAWRLESCGERVESSHSPSQSGQAMQVKMVATTGRLPAVETALLDMEEHQVRFKFLEQ